LRQKTDPALAGNDRERQSEILREVATLVDEGKLAEVGCLS
jgi:hypothetical protein